MTVKVEGQPAIVQALRQAQKEYPGALARALYAEGFAIQAEAVRKAPVDKAVLRTSAYTAPPKGPDGEVEVGFGTEYAVYQHERTELRHPRGGQSKYLETAVNERIPGILERLAKRTAENVASGQTTPSITPLGPTRPRDLRVEQRKAAEREQRKQVRKAFREAKRAKVKEAKRLKRERVKARKALVKQAKKTVKKGVSALGKVLRKRRRRRKR